MCRIECIGQTVPASGSLGFSELPTVSEANEVVLKKTAPESCSNVQYANVLVVESFMLITKHESGIYVENEPLGLSIDDWMSRVL